MRTGERMSSGRQSAVAATLLMTMALVGAGLQPASAYQRPGETQLISVRADGSQGSACSLPDPENTCNLDPWSSAITPDGRYVAFATDADGLDPRDKNKLSDVYVLDRKTKQLELISVSPQGVAAVGPPDEGGCSHGPYSGRSNYLSYDPSISWDGRYVAFTSRATNLVGGDTNLAADAFVWDRHSRHIERVSVDSEGSQTEPLSNLGCPSIPHSFGTSLDRKGRFVSFSSWAENLVSDDTNLQGDVFVRDLRRKRTERVSVATGGTQTYTECETFLRPREAPTDVRGGWCVRPLSSISANGRFVVFDTTASDVVEDDDNGMADVFVHDRKKDVTERVSVASGGGESKPSTCQTCLSNGEGASIAGERVVSAAGRVVSSDGRYVTFISGASDLVPNDTNRRLEVQRPKGLDIFVHDRRTTRTERISTDSMGRELQVELSRLTERAYDFELEQPSMTSNGRFVVWACTSGCPPGLVENSQHRNGIYLHDRLTGATEFVSRMARVPDFLENHDDGFAKDQFTRSPDVTGDGRYVTYSSPDWHRDDAGDRNPGVDIFLRDRGRRVDAGLGGSPRPKQNPPGEDRICVEGVCIPPGAAVSSSDATDDLDEVLTEQGANLYGASLAYRPQYEDLFAVIELEYMPKVIPGLSPIFYGLRLKVEGKSYEVRATSLDYGTFGLFECTNSPACTRVADLRGGYGTTGVRVVFSLPLAEIGIQEGGELSELVAFSGLGVYDQPLQIQDHQVLDRVALDDHR